MTSLMSKVKSLNLTRLRKISDGVLVLSAGIHRSVEMKFRFGKTAEELRRLMDLRRSSATTPTKNKKRYNRKVKHPKKDLDT